MRRKLALLMTAISLSVLGGVAIAGPASAGRDGPNPNSLNGQCTSAAAGKHEGWITGQHVGWERQGNTERRNVGGTCGATP